MQWDEIEQYLNAAAASFLQGDSFLLEASANERSMTHKFAEYLQREFGQRWHVDCEYNRDGIDDPKVLDLRIETDVRSDDDDATTVFPDIIVHHRGTSDNLVVIEAKKSRGKDARDRLKLERFTQAPFSYENGVLLRFITIQPFRVEFERYPE